MKLIANAMIHALGAVALSAVVPGTARAAPDAVKVECAAGQTIAQALRRGEKHRPLTVVISGTCNEHVTVDRSDVTLAADAPGATLRGPDPNTDTITVTGDRVSVLGLTVTGGRAGIAGVAGRNLLIKACIVEATGRDGITIAQGGNGTVDGCTVRNNARNGIAVTSASAAIINSTVTANGNVGIGFTDGASGRIGVTDPNAPGAPAAAGNTITNNANNGIQIYLGSSAFIAANIISGNGTNPALGRNGIFLSNSTASVVGLNSITGNAGGGIFAQSSTVIIGDPGLGLGTANTISGNGTGVASAGVTAFLGSSIRVRDAVISGNNGFGVFINLHSALQLVGNTTIQNSTGLAGSGDGIRLSLGSALLIDNAALATTAVTGNAGWGMYCTDNESSYFPFQPLPGFAPNVLGGVNTNCTAFNLIVPTAPPVPPVPGVSPVPGVPVVP
ncbi:MAG TPA: right-handed parallel beta-helix repeat-containing protein [Burkholderiales bacterium]|nr:right-handed parallel beta-helix repeat-containing protein [Burkholderiales bacterium]